MSEDNWENRGRQLRIQALALGIPTVIGISPIVGWFLGVWIGQAVGWDGAKYVGLVLGIAAGVRQSVRFIQQVNQLQQPPHSRKPPSVPPRK